MQLKIYLIICLLIILVIMCYFISIQKIDYFQGDEGEDEGEDDCAEKCTYELEDGIINNLCDCHNCCHPSSTPPSLTIPSCKNMSDLFEIYKC